MNKSGFSFSETDYAIVSELRRNGRATNQEIAEKLGLTATTVSSRIKRMEEANQLRVVAVSDFAALGYRALLRLAVEVDGRPASTVASDLAELPEIFAVHVVTGRYNIDALVALPDFAQLTDFLQKVVANVRGIKSMTPSIVVDILKYRFEVAPIEDGEK